MAQLRSPKAGLFVHLVGLLRSSHTLLGVFVLGSVGLFALARASYPVVAYGAAVVFAIEALVVLSRYAREGPERERSLPIVSVSHHETRIMNIEATVLERPEFKALLQGL